MEFEEDDRVEQVAVGGFQRLTGLFVSDIGFGAQLFYLFECNHGVLSSRFMGRSDADLVCDRDQDIARGLETADKKIRNA